MSLSVFRTFQDYNEALSLQELLFQNNIEANLIDNSANFVAPITGSALQDNFQILINPLDFEKANSLLEKEAEEIVKEIDKDYYLFGFSNDELKEIIFYPNEWSEIDYALAIKILKERGINYSKEKIQHIKQEQIEILSKPKDESKNIINTCFVLGVLGWAFIPFFLVPILMGFYLMKHKRDLPNGEKTFYYSEKSRKHGKIMLIFGFIMIFLFLAFRLTLEFIYY